jgi:hypothetical protein
LKNTIGERLLGLPGEPAVDRHIPFIELVRAAEEPAAGAP